jgi:hypothetical protein
VARDELGSNQWTTVQRKERRSVRFDLGKTDRAGRNHGNEKGKEIREQTKEVRAYEYCI